MATLSLVCRDCGHTFDLVTRSAVREKQKCCPECSSKKIRQTFGSFLQNGSLANPACGAPQRSSGYG